MDKGTVYIGTSGWHYQHWKRVFYPGDIKNEGLLAYYARVFKTVEINNSFYRLPLKDTFSTWASQVPEDFIFSVKGSRFFTHLKKLKISKTELRPFFSRIKGLKDKLGVVLFQLPPAWKVNPERLAAFFEKLPSGYRYSFEFRNTTWHDDPVYTLLKKYNSAFCIYDLYGQLSPLITTADFVYIRLHGPAGKYQGKYSIAALHTWAKRCRLWQEKGMDVYLYFDNDQAGYAPQNALTLSRKF